MLPLSSALKREQSFVKERDQRIQEIESHFAAEAAALNDKIRSLEGQLEYQQRSHALQLKDLAEKRRSAQVMIDDFKKDTEKEKKELRQENRKLKLQLSRTKQAYEKVVKDNQSLRHSLETEAETPIHRVQELQLSLEKCIAINTKLRGELGKVKRGVISADGQMRQVVGMVDSFTSSVRSAKVLGRVDIPVQHEIETLSKTLIDSVTLLDDTIGKHALAAGGGCKQPDKYREIKKALSIEEKDAPLLDDYAESTEFGFGTPPSKHI
ncbi:hypothetical protein ADUPG1_010537 [Aduncisulcus paluster]|uniref:Uncharacterized protein n=1 Tax=Aduncisulcus paluster TaxID=2918883 RepID=A0ABQ5JRT2_9EUKA|nr:hypothetical protein ADUPG1_010537 [Aduncisulcus paluster]|eukprot:gnl/Carplike_NY0171/7654_a10566_180.p1 GENE.gnl/Carplike_NY0171/7654_a10566_180~~gnl/Carplike_NY0171/7654_a10566_180.p1  ORF type:complete len:267 (-),score=59.12 gnl/Carplike_NY0171/7654_a10566_180:152-952(-)